MTRAIVLAVVAVLFFVGPVAAEKPGRDRVLRVDVVFDGKPVPDESGVFAAQVVNHPSHRRLFQR